jgi:hypothetical protein
MVPDPTRAPLSKKTASRGLRSPKSETSDERPLVPKRRRPSRAKPRPSSRRWKVPTQGVRPPERVGWKALLDLDPKPLECIVWMLCRLERGEYLGSHALARECGIRQSTASALLHSPWLDWARSVLHSGTALAVSQLANPNDLANLRAGLREHLGTASDGLDSTEKKEVSCQ